MSWSARPVVALPAIGLSAGFFSALFGVGGGVIVVPLLVLLLGYSTRWATGTSLAAIGLTSLFGMAAYGLLGEVSWSDAALVGFPAMLGTLLGTWAQQRVPTRTLTILFSLLLVAVAARLFIG
ncbi:MAG TPA: sulfite exporter TauE/SafE family protein [Gaiellaceae bacterium]|nr:sulfite exporter TauE/SafE family protein [Gaiellaceae bacterium]